MTGVEHDTVVTYWRTLADQKWKTAQALMVQGRYADALFFCHLALEAELKASVVVATGEHAPLVHDLVKLSRVAKLPLTSEQTEALEEISTFNIAGRYDDYKLSFYKKATKRYAEAHLHTARTLRTWIRKNTQLEK